VRRIVLFALSAAALLGSSGMAAAPSPFDGMWSVLVVTEQGTCDRGYRYALRVVNGVVRYEGEAAVNVNGRVAPNGTVHVIIRRGDRKSDV